MPRASAGTLLRHLRELVGPRDDERSDRELVEGFLARRDEAAFAALLHRHGPLVWRVCRRALPDEQVARLPRTLRAPFILCCLEGRSRPEAATELGWKEGTVSSRIAQARKLLEGRLARRGVTLSGALTAGAMASQTVSAALVQPTLQAAMRIAAGEVVCNVVAPSVAALAEVAMRAMLSVKA